jgi:hypothetical protein
MNGLKKAFFLKSKAPIVYPQHPRVVESPMFIYWCNPSDNFYLGCAE